MASSLSQLQALAVKDGTTAKQLADASERLYQTKIAPNIKKQSPEAQALTKKAWDAQAGSVIADKVKRDSDNSFGGMQFNAAKSATKDLLVPFMQGSSDSARYLAEFVNDKFNKGDTSGTLGQMIQRQKDYTQSLNKYRSPTSQTGNKEDGKVMQTLHAVGEAILQSPAQLAMAGGLAGGAAKLVMGGRTALAAAKGTKVAAKASKAAKLTATAGNVAGQYALAYAPAKDQVMQDQNKRDPKTGAYVISDETLNKQYPEYEQHYQAAISNGLNPDDALTYARQQTTESVAKSHADVIAALQAPIEALAPATQIIGKAMGGGKLVGAAASKLGLSAAPSLTNASAQAALNNAARTGVAKYMPTLSMGGAKVLGLQSGVEVGQQIIGNVGTTHAANQSGGTEGYTFENTMKGSVVAGVTGGLVGGGVHVAGGTHQQQTMAEINSMVNAHQANVTQAQDIQTRANELQTKVNTNTITPQESLELAALPKQAEHVAKATVDSEHALRKLGVNPDGKAMSKSENDAYQASLVPPAEDAPEPTATPTPTPAPVEPEVQPSDATSTPQAEPATPAPESESKVSAAVKRARAKQIKENETVKQQFIAAHQNGDEALAKSTLEHAHKNLDLSTDETDKWISEANGEPQVAQETAQPSVEPVVPIDAAADAPVAQSDDIDSLSKRKADVQLKIAQVDKKTATKANVAKRESLYAELSSLSDKIDSLVKERTEQNATKKPEQSNTKEPTTKTTTPTTDFYAARKNGDIDGMINAASRASDEGADEKTLNTFTAIINKDRKAKAVPLGTPEQAHQAVLDKRTKEPAQPVETIPAHPVQPKSSPNKYGKADFMADYANATDAKAKSALFAKATAAGSKTGDVAAWISEAKQLESKPVVAAEPKVSKSTPLESKPEPSTIIKKVDISDDISRRIKEITEGGHKVDFARDRAFIANIKPDPLFRSVDRDSLVRDFAKTNTQDESNAVYMVAVSDGYSNDEIIGMLEDAGKREKPSKNKTPKDAQPEAALDKLDQKDTKPKSSKPDSSGKQPAGWVIKEKGTGEIIMETFDKKKVDALNKTKYEATPIREHLEGLNKKPVIANTDTSSTAEPVKPKAPVKKSATASTESVPVAKETDQAAPTAYQPKYTSLLNKARQDKHLDMKVNHSRLGVITKRGIIDDFVNRGAKVEEHQVEDKAASDRLTAERERLIKQGSPLGNENLPRNKRFAEIEQYPKSPYDSRRVRVMKTEHHLQVEGEDIFHELTAFGADYARQKIAERDAPKSTPAPELSNIISDEQSAEIDARMAVLDKKIDNLSEDQINKAWDDLKLAGKNLHVEKKREALKQEHPDDLDRVLSDQAAPESTPSKFQAFHDAAQQYGLSVKEDGRIVSPNGRDSNAKVTLKGAKFKIDNDAGHLLFTGGDASGIGKFIADYWGYSKLKTSETKLKAEETKLKAETSTPESVVEPITAQPVHDEDDGSTPEVATPEIVRESLQTAANKIKRPLLDMKKDLLAQIDAAMKDAKPAEDVTIDVTNNRGTEIKVNLSKYPVNWVNATLGLGSKAPYIYDSYTVKKPNKILLTQAEAERLRDHIRGLTAGSKIKFNVEGDGRFTVTNTKESLAEFRKKIDNVAFKNTAPPRQSKPDGASASNVAAIRDMLSDSTDPYEIENAVQYAQLHGDIGFGTGKDGIVVYAFTENVDIGGIPAFVGLQVKHRDARNNDSGGNWFVVEPNTGLALSNGSLGYGYSTKSQAIDAAEKGVKESKAKGLFEKSKKQIEDAKNNGDHQKKLADQWRAHMVSKGFDEHTEVDQAAHQAATSHLNDTPAPTAAQIEAGNYKKGHVSIQGLDITIENPKGSERSGKREDGTTWTHTMSDHYGYVKGTEGADGEHVDAYIGSNPDSFRVYVVDQLDQKTGEFDEHKVMIGFKSQTQAEAAYQSNFDKDWKMGEVTRTNMDDFKDWLKDGDTTKPFSKSADTTNPDIRFSRSAMTDPATAETGKPIKVNYSRNTESSKAHGIGTDFGQDIEPSGEYMNIDTSDMSKGDVAGWEYGTISFKNPLVLDHKSTNSTGWKKDLSEMFDGKTGKALTAAIKKAGYDAVVTKDQYGYSETVNLSGVKTPKADPNKNLFVAHNLSAENILAAHDLGGLAAPSIAIARSDRSDFSGFGEVTLLADPSLLNDSKIKTFDADVYSPRQPRALYDVNRKQFNELLSTLDPDNYGLRKPDLSDAESTNGAEELLRSDAMKMKFLQDKGVAPKPKALAAPPLIKQAAKIKGDIFALTNDPKFAAIATKYYKAQVELMAGLDPERAQVFQSLYFEEDGNLKDNSVREFAYKAKHYRDSGGKDMSKLSADIQAKFRNQKLNDEYERWVTDTFNGMVDGKKLFKGFTNQGNRRYSPYTMENVVKEMTQTIRGGEGTFYGAGSVRSAYATELKNIKAIQANRDKVVSSEEMKRIKDESSEKFAQALDDLRPFYKFDANRFGYMDDAGSAIQEGGRALSETFNLTPESRKIISDLTTYLRNLPTDYFEAKAQRAVQFNEFNTAIVPKGLRADALKVLKDAGLTIKTYDSSIEGDRARAIAQQDALLFKKGNVGAGKSTTPISELFTPLTKREVERTAQAIIDKINADRGTEKGAKLAFNVKVLASFDEFPAHIKQAYYDQGGENASLVDGTLDGDTVYMVAPNIVGDEASNHTTVDQIQKVLFHEIYGHFGTAQLFGADYQKKMQALYNAVGGHAGIRKLAKANNVDLTHYEEGFADAVKEGKYTQADVNRAMIDELLAHIVQSHKANIRTKAKEYIGAIRQALRDLGWVKFAEYGNTDLFHLLKQARKAAFDPIITHDRLAAPAFNKSESPEKITDTKAFKQWFGGSKVVDANGDPLVVYHGTNSPAFHEFNTSDRSMDFDIPNNRGDNIGAFFAANKNHSKEFGRNNGAYFLSIKNPKVFSTQDEFRSYVKSKSGTSDDIRDNEGFIVEEGVFSNKTRASIEAEGFDGVQITRPTFTKSPSSDKAWFIAFHPEQIKSATSNVGTFDATNPDIRFSYFGESSKTADESQLAKAIEMLYDNKDMNEIRKETGWFLGVDHQWRYEVSDLKSKFNVKGTMKDVLVDVRDDLELSDTAPIFLSSMFQHDELFKAYPELNYIEVRPTTASHGDALGGYDHENRVMFVDPSQSVEEGRKTILHEIQHAIQEIEGFARGGNQQDEMLQQHAEAKGYKNIDAIRDKVKSLKSKLDGLSEDFYLAMRSQKTAEQRKKATVIREAMTPIQDEIQALSTINVVGSKVFYDYQRLAGEIESRDVEHRINFTDEQRKDNVPYESQGIPSEFVTVRFSKDDVHPETSYSQKDNLDYAAEVIKALAVSDPDNIHRYPVVDSKDLKEQMSETVPNAEHVRDWVDPAPQVGRLVNVSTYRMKTSGKEFHIFESNTGKVWIDVSELKEGGGGQGIYMAVGDYAAANKGKQFIGDPTDLSEPARVRRTVNMLTLAVRHGGRTDFLAPHLKQEQGNAERGVAPLKWTTNDIDNVRSLIDTFLTTTKAQAKGLEGYSYDFATKQFIDPDGQPVSIGDLATDVSTSDRSSGAAAAQLGKATARRYIFLKSLISSEGGASSQARDRLLGDLRSGNNELASSPSTTQLFSRRNTEFEGVPTTPKQAKAWNIQRAKDSFVVGWLQRRAEGFHHKVNTQLHHSIVDKAFKPVYNLIQERLNHIAIESSHAMNEAPEILGRLDNFKDFGKTLKNTGSSIKGSIPYLNSKFRDDMQAASEVLYDGTKIDEKVYSDQELKDKGLTPDQMARYREMRAAIDTSVEQFAKTNMSMVAKVEDIFLGSELHRLHDADLSMDRHGEMLTSKLLAVRGVLDPDEQSDRRLIKRIDKAIQDIKDIANRARTLAKEGYAPMMRFGDYTLGVREKDSEDLLVYEHYETKAARDKAKRALIEAGYTSDKYDISTSTQNPDEYKMFVEQGVNPETLSLFAKQAGVNDDALQQAYLKLAKSPNSALKRMMHRKGIAGYSENTSRVISAFVISNARRSANLLYNQDVQNAVMRISDGTVQASAQRLMEYVMNPIEEASGWRSFMFTMYMGFSPAFGLLNLTQPYMQTLPELTRYLPAGQAAKLMVSSSAMAGKLLKDEKNIPAEFAQDYAMLKRKGLFDPQNVWALQGRERGRSTAGSTWEMIQHAGSIFAQASEAINRRTAVIAALRTAKILGEAGLKKHGFDSPYDFAVHVVRTTQGVMNKGNNPAIARGWFGASVMAFRTFGIQYIEQMWRMIKSPMYAGQKDKFHRALVLSLLLMFGFAGMKGLPFVKVAIDLTETAANMIGSPINLEREAQELLGVDGAENVLNGVFDAVGFDMSGSMGMQNLIPSTRVAHPDADMTKSLLEIFGATGGMGKKLIENAERIKAGNAGDAAIDMLPKGLSGLAAGIKTATTGEARTVYGNRLTDITAGESAIKALSLNPSRLAAEGRIRMLEREDTAIQDSNKKYFRDKWIEAAESGDDAAVQDIKDKIEAWNEKNPKYPVYITDESIEKSVGRRGEDWQDRNKPKKGLEWMDEMRGDGSAE